jgi:hypothetical protein
MRHAYLILAHHEFDLLQILINCIDDVRNDIYIHVDAKVDTLPHIEVKYSRLYFVSKRINVHWGDLSVVKAEIALFAEASAISSYSYYHLISGVDMPLKTQDAIHSFFDKHQGMEFIGFSQYDYNKEVMRKVNLYHLFSHEFKNQKSLSLIVKRVIRGLYIRIQLILGLRRNRNCEFKKGTQWVSITDNFVKLLLSEELNIYKVYKNTFCSDEIYKQTICWNSNFRNSLYNYLDESLGCMRMIGWRDGQLYDWEQEDLEMLIQSKMIFARKFSIRNSKLLEDLRKYLDGVV